MTELTTWAADSPLDPSNSGREQVRSESEEPTFDGVERPLADRMPQCERAGWRLLLYILFPGVALAWLAIERPSGLAWLWFAVTPWVLAWVTLRLVMCFVRRSFDRTHWYLAADHEMDARSGWLEIHRGVWWRKVITVPRSRVQHTDVTQGPLERRYGLATLVIHTAGTHLSTVRLNGLAKGTAESVRDLLIEREASRVP